MSRVFVSGSSTGLGLLAGKAMIAAGQDVVCHAPLPDQECLPQALGRVQAEMGDLA